MATTIDSHYYLGQGSRGSTEREFIVIGKQKEPIVLESNQNHATITQTGICTALPAAMGEGGGYIPMVAYENERKGCDADCPIKK